MFYSCSEEYRFSLIDFEEGGVFYIFILCDVSRGVEIAGVKDGWKWEGEAWFG